MTEASFEKKSGDYSFASLDQITQQLLNTYQKDFPIVSNPFEVMAEKFECSEPDILSRLLMLKDQGIVTRIGPVFDHKRAGASLLAAVNVPEEKEFVAQQINEYAEVNHNYGREHDYNLWFVVTAPSKHHLQSVLANMEADIGYKILHLPMIKAYHIDLGFNLSHHYGKTGYQSAKSRNHDAPVFNGTQLLSSDLQQQLRVLIQDGLPLTRFPFQFLADKLSVNDESLVMNTIQYWLDTGLIKRLGLVSNHHKLGFTSNAMVVWDVPADQVDRIGEIFKHTGLVSLCYQRERHLPHWSYNLYCMIHSRDRESVYEDIKTLKALVNDSSIKNDVLFSNCQYKQKGGLYSIGKGRKSQDQTMLKTKNMATANTVHTQDNAVETLGVVNG